MVEFSQASVAVAWSTIRSPVITRTPAELTVTGGAPLWGRSGQTGGASRHHGDPIFTHRNSPSDSGLYALM